MAFTKMVPGRDPEENLCSKMKVLLKGEPFTELGWGGVLYEGWPDLSENKEEKKNKNCSDLKSTEQWAEVVA